MPSPFFIRDSQRDSCIGSNFWKFYLVRTGFTLDERVSLVKVFRLEQQMFFSEGSRPEGSKRNLKFLSVMRHHF
jgi:hypothetical protein